MYLELLENLASGGNHARIGNWSVTHDHQKFSAILHLVSGSICLEDYADIEKLARTMTGIDEHVAS